MPGMIEDSDRQTEGRKQEEEEVEEVMDRKRPEREEAAESVNTAGGGYC